MIHHFDTFERSGNAEDAAWWGSSTGASWPMVQGGAAMDVITTVPTTANFERLIHQTDAGLELPRSHAVRARFRFSEGGNVVGVSTLGVASPDDADRVEAWIQTNTSTLFLRVPGRSLQAMGVPALPNDIGIEHLLELRAIYQSSPGGVPHWVFEVRLNGGSPLTSPAVPVAGWTSAKVYPGLVAQRVNGPVYAFGEAVVFVDEFELDDLEVSEHDPKPTVTPATARTPITPATEKPVGSPPDFPGTLRIRDIRHPREVAELVSDEEYDWTSARQTRGRRFFECIWRGDDSDRDQLEALFDAYGGSELNFRVTVHDLAIGTVDVIFAEPELTTEHLGGAIYGASFILAEVF